MRKKYSGNIADEFDSGIIFNDGEARKTPIQKTSVLITWANATGTLDGELELRAYIGDDADEYDVVDTITIDSALGRESIYSEILCVGCQVVLSKNNVTGGTFKINVMVL